MVAFTFRSVDKKFQSCITKSWLLSKKHNGLILLLILLCHQVPFLSEMILMARLCTLAAVFTTVISFQLKSFQAKTLHTVILFKILNLVAKKVKFKISVSFDGQEIPQYSYEVLCNGNVQWVHSGHGAHVPNAIPAGRTSSGETLYVGRAWHAGSLTPGKVHPSHGNLYIPYNGGEVAIGSYEVLVEN